jgi:hypothetical protein
MDEGGRGKSERGRVKRERGLKAWVFKKQVSQK